MMNSQPFEIDCPHCGASQDTDSSRCGGMMSCAACGKDYRAPPHEVIEKAFKPRSQAHRPTDIVSEVVRLVEVIFVLAGIACLALFGLSLGNTDTYKSLYRSAVDKERRAEHALLFNKDDRIRELQYEQAKGHTQWARQAVAESQKSGETWRYRLNLGFGVLVTSAVFWLILTFLPASWQAKQRIPTVTDGKMPGV